MQYIHVWYKTLTLHLHTLHTHPSIDPSRQDQVTLEFPPPPDA